MKTCTHDRVVTDDSSICCFNGSVAVSPFTEENRAAHGNIQYIETCQDCGRERRVNSNNGTSEFGPWNVSRSERQRQEKARQVQDQQIYEDDLVSRRDVDIVRYREASPDWCEHVLIRIDGQHRTIPMWQIEQAARQDDNGDNLVPFYRGLLRKINLFRRGYFAHASRTGA